MWCITFVVGIVHMAAGVDVVAAIRSRADVVLATAADDDYAAACLASGASSYVIRTCTDGCLYLWCPSGFSYTVNEFCR